jgi:TonB family protein
MLMEPNPAAGKRSRAMTVSVVLHVAVLAVICYQPEPIFVNPNYTQLGSGPITSHVVLYAPDTSAEPEESEHDKLTLNGAAPKFRKTQANKIKPKEKPTWDQRGEVADKNATAGTPFGSLYEAMSQGHDVKPAIPFEFPAPDVSHAELPEGFSGDVIVEVTIDRDGTVTQMKLLKSIAPHIDQKVLAAVQRWKFRPAVLDGTPIASKHDVHFHFPS